MTGAEPVVVLPAATGPGGEPSAAVAAWAAYGSAVECPDELPDVRWELCDLVTGAVVLVHVRPGSFRHVPGAAR